MDLIWFLILPYSAASERAGTPLVRLCPLCAWSGPPPSADCTLLALRERRKNSRLKNTVEVGLVSDQLNLCDVTTVEVDGANELQVSVYSPDAVHVTTVLESGADRCFIQVPGLALQPNVKKECVNQ